MQCSVDDVVKSIASPFVILSEPVGKAMVFLSTGIIFGALSYRVLLIFPMFTLRLRLIIDPGAT